MTAQVRAAPEAEGEAEGGGGGAQGRGPAVRRAGGSATRGEGTVQKRQRSHVLENMTTFLVQFRAL